jgi:Tol biopolymer transport system component
MRSLLRARHLVPFAALLLFGCEAPRSVSPVRPSEPRLEISDGAHNGGNSHFVFLPPMVGQTPVAKRPADVTLLPTVQVCEWSAGACGTVVATFTTVAGTGGARVALSGGTAGSYGVNWDTGKCSQTVCQLDVRKTYRVVVSVAGIELGHLDLVVVSSGSALKNVDTQEYVGLLDGRTLPIRFRIEQGAIAATAVGASGGTVTLASDVTLAIPAGALAAATTITVVPEAAAAGDSRLIAGSTYQFGPDGTTFRAPVTLRLAYDPALLPAGVSEQHLHVVTRDAQGGEWTEVPGSTVDVATKTVTAAVTHFSEYGLMEFQQVTRIALELRDPTNGGVEIGAFYPLARFAASMYLDNGPEPVAGRNPVVTSSDTTVARIVEIKDWDDYGPIDQTHATVVYVFEPLRLGTTRMTVSIDGVSEHLDITVIPDVVAGVYVEPEATTVSIGGQQQYTVSMSSKFGVPITGRTVVWSVLDPAIATISPTTGLVRGMSGGCTRVTASVPADNTAGATPLTVTPATPWIVSIGIGSSSNELWVNGIGRCDPRPLTATPNVREAKPRWSPDGSKILYVDADRGDLYWMDAYGGSPHPIPISHGARGTRSGTWSPDVTRILFTGEDPTSQTEEIVVADLDGSNERQVTTGTRGTYFYAEEPRWSPDGSKIAYYRGGTRKDVFVVNVDGTDPHRVTSPGCCGQDPESMEPEWSPDGSHLAFIYNSQLYTARPDGSDLREVVHETNGVQADFSWSPDGSHLAYFAFGPSYGLRVVNVDGTGLTTIARFPQMQVSAWTRDSKSVIAPFFLSSNNKWNMWSFPIDGSESIFLEPLNAVQADVRP